eukprot:SAG31_NODE_22521_length_524_cov_0.376471_2_plen_89_part_00
MEVIAKTVDLIHIKYDCPYCHRQHKNGSSGDLSNRVEYRGLTGHCNKKGHPSDIIIHITDETEKIKKSNNKYGKKKKQKISQTKAGGE